MLSLELEVLEVLELTLLESVAAGFGVMDFSLGTGLLGVVGVLESVLSASRSTTIGEDSELPLAVSRVLVIPGS